METKLKRSSVNNPKSDISYITDVEISESEISRIIEHNVDYFNLIKSGLIKISTVKFQLVKDIIVMRTFDKEGHESATYYVQDTGKLQLYKDVVTDNSIYSQNGLNVVEYDEDENGVTIYQILDENGLDPVGDGFSFEEAISFVGNY